MKRGISSLKRNLLCAASAAAAAIPAAALAVNPDDVSAREKIDYLTGANDPLANALIGVAVLAGVVIFSALFIKLWNLPRMGYFMVTLSILAVRYFSPEIIFWKVAAVSAALFSLLMFVLSHRHLDFDSRKEPLYFLFNAFTLFIASFQLNFFLSAMACTSLIASLFFVVTRKPVPHGKFKQLEADEKIMETLEKKAKRPT